MADRFVPRYGTKKQWEDTNPYLMLGEIGFVTDADTYKIGDGINRWNDLEYRGLPCVDELGDSTTSAINQKTVTEEFLKRVLKNTFLNVSQETGNYAFASPSDARLAVAVEKRGFSQVLVYQTTEKTVVEYCITQDIFSDEAWSDDSSWKAVGSGGALNISEEMNNYAFSSPIEARMNVQASDRKQGQMIAYKVESSGWVYEMFTGEDTDEWMEADHWWQFSTNTDISSLRSAINQAKEDLQKEIAGKADGCYLNDDNKLQLTSGGKDIGDPLELTSGIVNLSHDGNIEYASETDARKAVKNSDRILGQLITYKLNDGNWLLEHFIGESTGSWENDGSWRQIAITNDLAPLLDEMETLSSQLEMLQANVKGKADGFYIDSDGESSFLVLTANGEELDRVQLPEGGGGGGVSPGIRMRVRAVGGSSLVVGEKEDAIIQYNFSSIDLETEEETGDGTVLITVNGYTVYTGTIPQGDNSFNLRGRLNLGANTVRVRVTDAYENSATITFNVQMATLSLTSTFADDQIYTSSPVAFRYTPVGTGTKTIRFWLNDVEIDSEITTTSGRQLTKNLTGLKSGANTIRAVAESSVEGAQLTSNELYYEFIYADASVTEPIITISFRESDIAQFRNIDIPFMVYDPLNTVAEVELIINDVVKQELTVPRSRQLWGYYASEQGTYKMEIRCRNVTKSITLEVVPSEYDIAEEKGDLRYKVSAVGKSNNGSDRASWQYGEYDALFKNFQWAEDGWQKDSENKSHLRLIADSEVEIGINPFNANVLLNGMTLTVEFATANVTDSDAVIISSMFNGIGIEITPSLVRISSAQSILTANLDSSTKTSISFVVQKLVENRLIFLYVDGVMSGSMQYPASDNFTQSTAAGLTLSTGGRTCTTMIYGIRWYENNLNDDQVLGNYIYDVEDFDEKIIIYNRNNIVNEYGNIDAEKAASSIQYVVIEGELPTYKGDKKTNNVSLTDILTVINSFIANLSENDVQGTSSQYYPRKNFKFKFKNGITLTFTGEYLEKYQMQGTQIPADVFCMKADFAESSGTHNTGMAVLIDEALRKLGMKVPPQAQDDRIRTTVYGFPVLIFHKADANSQPEFIGKYNFNDDKSSTQVFGFEPGHECWEFCNNTSDLCLFKSADFSGDWVDNDFEGRYPDGNDDGSNLKPLFEWVVSCKNNPAKFKAECAEHFNVDWLLFYCLTTELFGMVDQRAKNQMLTTYGERGSTGELIWYFIFYDNDTVLGVNNEGLIAFDPYIETQDPHGDGHVWNGWNSELWTLVEAAYKDEMKAMYQRIRQQNVFSTSVVLEVLQNRFADKWAEVVYNRDGFFKYIEPLIKDNNGAYLYALQGSRTRHRLWWVKERFTYMDSKYGAGDYMTDYATMRLYTPVSWAGVQPTANFAVKLRKPGYFHVKYGSYETTPVRGYAGENYDVIAPNIQFNDTETIFYGINAVSSLGDLSGKYPGTVDISKADALEELIIGSTATGYKNENLTVLHTGTNEILRKINVANCPNLRQSLELTKCYSLEEVEARGSGITGLSLPSSGILKTLNLPESFTALYLKNQPYLTTLTLEGYANLNTIVIENVPSIDPYEFVRRCINTEGNKLGKVRITGINAYDDSARVIMSLLGMTGEDDNGNPTSVAVVTGRLHVTSVSQNTLDRVRSAFPDLQFTYDEVLNVIDFEDDIVKTIMVANYDSNKDGEISADEVQYSNIPRDLLKGSGAKKFNELVYWGGVGSIINDVDTLEEVSLQAGKAELNNLPNLKKLAVYSDSETLDANPGFGYNTVQNCYGIEEFILSGRYTETARKGAIMARQIISSIESYRMMLPLRGYTSLTIDEKLRMLLTDANEATFSWGNSLTSLTINKLYDVTLPVYPNLQTLIIRGSSEHTNKLVLGTTLPTLQNLVINDTSGNNIDVLDINCAVRNFEFSNLRCNGAQGSYFRLRGDTAIVQRLDFPETYQPAGIQFGQINTGGTPFINGAIIIIRSPVLIPCTAITSTYNGVQTSVGAIYVPDGLVSLYKASTNWSHGNWVNKIQPLSNLG